MKISTVCCLIGLCALVAAQLDTSILTANSNYNYHYPLGSYPNPSDPSCSEMHCGTSSPFSFTQLEKIPNEDPCKCYCPESPIYATDKYTNLLMSNATATMPIYPFVILNGTARGDANNDCKLTVQECSGLQNLDLERTGCSCDDAAGLIWDKELEGCKCVEARSYITRSVGVSVCGACPDGQVADPDDPTVCIQSAMAGNGTIAGDITTSG